MTIKEGNRSDKYQWVLLETVVSGEFLSSFSNNDGLYKSHPISEEDREELLYLDGLLKDELLIAIQKSLTEMQYKVLIMYADGMTQNEIAKSMGVNQSSITKSLNGNVDYAKGKKVYGGIKKKMSKLILLNQTIKPIMKQIYEKWEPGCVRLNFYQTFRSLFPTNEAFEKWLVNDPSFNLLSSSKALKGVAGGMDHLAPEIKLEIKTRYEEGLSVQLLSRKFKLSKRFIKQIVEIKE
jgi:transcriptional regulator